MTFGDENFEKAAKKSYSEMNPDELKDSIARLEAVLNNPEDAGIWDDLGKEGIARRLEEAKAALKALSA